MIGWLKRLLRLDVDPCPPSEKIDEVRRAARRQSDAERRLRIVETQARAVRRR